MTVGTKIKIIRTTNGCLGAEGMVGVVTNERSTNGMFNSDKGYNVQLDNGEVWRINSDAEVRILSTKLPELEVGMFGVTNEGKLFVVTEFKGDKVLAYANCGEDSGFDKPCEVGVKRLIKAHSFFACNLYNKRSTNIIWEYDERESKIKELEDEMDRIKAKIAELREV